MKVLVVENDDVQRESVVLLLQTAGHTVGAVPDGFLAVDRLTERSYDALVIDLAMPGMNGYEVMEHAGRLPPHIAVTTGLEKRIVDIGRLPPQAVVLQKPYDPEALLAVVEGGL